MSEKLIRRELQQLLPPLIEGKDVLDLGCLNHEQKRYGMNPVHSYICKFSKSCLGVDFEKEVLKLKKEGYNVVWSDVLALDLPKKFDVVFAGEFIEHLANHTQFLKVVSKHLKDDGLFVLTTPNPYFYLNFLRILFKDDYIVSPYHYCYFCPKTLQKLLEDHNFRVTQFHWLNEASHKSIGYFPIWLRRTFSSNFMVVAKKHPK